MDIIDFLERQHPNCIALAKFLLRISKNQNTNIFPISVSQLAVSLGVARGTLHNRLNTLREIGFLRFPQGRKQHVALVIEILHVQIQNLHSRAKRSTKPPEKSSLKTKEVSDGSNEDLSVGAHQRRLE